MFVDHASVAFDSEGKFANLVVELLRQDADASVEASHRAHVEIFGWHHCARLALLFSCGSAHSFYGCSDFWCAARGGQILHVYQKVMAVKKAITVKNSRMK